MEVKDAKYIIDRLNSFTNDLNDLDLCEMIDWFIFGSTINKEKDTNSEYLVSNILGEEVFDSWMNFLRTGEATEHSGLMNMTRVHLLQIAFDRFRKTL